MGSGRLWFSLYKDLSDYHRGWLAAREECGQGWKQEAGWCRGPGGRLWWARPRCWPCRWKEVGWFERCIGGSMDMTLETQMVSSMMPNVLVWVQGNYDVTPDIGENGKKCVCVFRLDRVNFTIPVGCLRNWGSGIWDGNIDLGILTL